MSRVERASGPVWYAKYRLSDGHQVQKKIGPAWTERGRPPVGWFTKRTAEAWMRDVLDQARRGTLPGMVRIGVTFGDAAEEWLRFIEEDRVRKPSTLNDYRSALKAHLLPAFGSLPLESITPEQIDAWRRGLTRFVRTVLARRESPWGSILSGRLSVGAVMGTFLTGISRQSTPGCCPTHGAADAGVSRRSIEG
jgi:hypothetical protein